MNNNINSNGTFFTAGMVIWIQKICSSKSEKTKSCIICTKCIAYKNFGYSFLSHLFTMSKVSVSCIISFFPSQQGAYFVRQSFSIAQKKFHFYATESNGWLSSLRVPGWTLQQSVIKYFHFTIHFLTVVLISLSFFYFRIGPDYLLIVWTKWPSVILRVIIKVNGFLLYFFFAFIL